jgi:uncharacterized membrane protein (DUF2068 family)
MSRGPEMPDDFGGKPLMRSGAVTAVAIVNFVLGGLQTLFGLLVMILGPTAMAFITGVAKEGTAQIQTQGLSPAEAEKVKQAAQAVAQAGGGIVAFVAGLIGVCFMIFGVPILVAGFGVLGRRQWGRILTIVMGIICILWGALNLFTGNVVSLAYNLGYGIFVLVVLFNSKFAAEFK